jgi:putative tryptophan/tyrosine transport system substrate-binding protein
MLNMRRREFISLLGGAAAAWPLAARGQQGERVRRIGVLHTLTPDDPGVRPRNEAFVQRLQQLGWHEGQNVRIDYRWGAGSPDNTRKYAMELAALAPDVILAIGSSTLGPLLQATRAVPIVFVIVPDPVGSGFVDSLARPGGNATGFLTFEFGISGKWLELLKEIAPRVMRAAVIRDPAITAGIGQWGQAPGGRGHSAARVRCRRQVLARRDRPRGGLASLSHATAAAARFLDAPAFC